MSFRFQDVWSWLNLFSGNALPSETSVVLRGNNFVILSLQRKRAQVDHPANIHLLKAWLLSSLSHFLCHYSCRLMLSADNFRNGQSISGFSSLTRKQQALCTQRTFSAISFWSSLRYRGQHSDIITGFYFLEKVDNRWHPPWEAKSCKVHLDFLWNLSRSCVKACSVRVRWRDFSVFDS